MKRWRLPSSGIAGLALVATALSVSAPEEPSGARNAASMERHRERPGDPFVAVSRAEQLRSPALAVMRGQHRSIQVNVDSAGNNILGDAADEPSLAVDPTHPGNLVVGWRQFDTVASNFRQAGYAYSHDGGATWTFPGVLQPGQFRSDPVLAADSAGTFFYYSLNSVTTGDLFISSDKGLNWSGPFPGRRGR